MACILVVEDEPFILHNAEWTLRDLGHSALIASDLEEALVHLSAQGWIDALFVDIRLNTLALGGYDVANQAVVLKPDLRVLYTSGSELTDGIKGLFVCGAQFLQKPYTAQQLEFSVAGLLSQ